MKTKATTAATALCLASVLSTVWLLAGCAVSSGIEQGESSKSGFDGAVYPGKTTQINPPLPGVPTHRIFHQGATGFTSLETVRKSVMERVTTFCTQSGQNVYLVQETDSQPPHILGNWPRAEVVFSCVPGAQASAPTVMAPVSTPATPASDKYDRLTKLKALLDSGAITQTEYDAEKKKLLSE